MEYANIKFLLTGRLNQDALESMFATIRGKIWYHVNPNARQFRAALSQARVDSLMPKSDDANCQDDLDSFLLSLISLKTARVDDVRTTPTTQDGMPQAVGNLVNVFCEQMEATSRKDQHIACYIAGYIARKVATRLPQCNEHFKNTNPVPNEDPETVFLDVKIYDVMRSKMSGLVPPTKQLVEVVEALKKVPGYLQ